MLYRIPNIPLDDVGMLESLALTLENSGNMYACAKVHIQIADSYYERKQLDEAMCHWLKATRLMPNLLAIHARLGQAYERTGQVFRAVQQYLLLEAGFVQEDQQEMAAGAGQQAQQLLAGVLPAWTRDVQPGAGAADLTDEEKTWVSHCHDLLAAGEHDAGIAALDQVLWMLADAGKFAPITRTLEIMIAKFPDEKALYIRMASIYKRLGRNKDALAMLEKYNACDDESA